MPHFTWKRVVPGARWQHWSQTLVAVVLGLIWLAPSAADAAILKRVHSGTTNVTNAAGVTVALELPNPSPSNAFVVCTARTTWGGEQQRVTCVLSNNSLTIDAGANYSTGSMNVSWYVVEFESGVTVQRGTAAFAAGTASVPVTLSPAVDCSKSFVVAAGDQSDVGSATTTDEQFTFLQILGTVGSPCAVTAGTTTSTLTLSRLATGTAATVAWQVVTMDGATVVARSTATIATNATTAIPGIPSTTPGQAFILMSRQAGTATGGIENLHMVRADFSSCSPNCAAVTFTRDNQTGAANTQVQVAYEVVRLDDGGNMQRGSTFSSGTTTTIGPITIGAIDRSATVPIFTASVGGTTNSATLWDAGTWSASFPLTTQLQFTRGNSLAPVGTVNWFVVSFYKCQNSRLCSVGVKGGNAAATVSWSPIYDTQCVVNSKQSACEAIVFRDTNPISWTPSNVAYTVGLNPAGSPASLRTVFIGATGTTNPALQSSSDTITTPALANGTKYYYRVYPKVNGANTYITDIAEAISEVNVTPSANANLAWSYMTTGGSTLNAPIAGNGRVYIASNGSKIVALNSSTGMELVTPLITNGAIQSYLSWFPVSGGANEAVVVGDQTGRLTSMDGVTGARNWTVKLPVDATGFIQAALSAQLRAYANAGFSGTYATDLIYVASRDNLQTTNNVWAVRADNGQTQWQFTPAGAAGMDRAAGQPYVDYSRNRLWVSTGNNSGQKSLWVVNTLTGVETTSFPSFGNQTNSAPTLSADGTTVYVGDAAGNVYAVDAATNGTIKKYSLLLGGTSPSISGYIWEDWTTPGKLYIPVITSGSAGVWCVQDNGSALVACPSWTTNPRTGSTTLGEPLVTGTAIFYPVSDGNIYQINTSDGTLYGGTGHPFMVESGVTLGGISTEDWTQLYIGTSSGRSYRINLTGGNLP